MYM
jgi:hypothetical protein